MSYSQLAFQLQHARLGHCDSSCILPVYTVKALYLGRSSKESLKTAFQKRRIRCTLRELICSQPLIDAFSMRPVAQMNLEVTQCHIGARGVQLARTVLTSDTGEVCVLNMRWRGLVWLQSVWRYGFSSSGVISAPSHQSFEGVFRILILQCI
jgi:hypothetical protein